MRLLSALKVALEAWLDAERERLALWLPVFMGAGVLAYYALRFEPAPWVGIAVAIPAVGLAIGVPCGRSLLGPIAAAALGFAAAQIATACAPPIEVDLPTHATIVTGTIRAVEVLPKGRRVTIQPAWIDAAAEPLRRSVRIRLQDKDDGALSSGDSLRIRALIRPPALPSYPGAWDLQRNAFYTGLGASGYALGRAERTAQVVPSGPMQFVQWLRELISDRIVKAIPGVAGSVSVTMLIGGAVAISDSDWAAFRDSGLARLLAVSGSNMVVVVGCVLMVVRFGFALSERASLYWPTKKLSVLCGLVAAAAYMVLCGMQVPIVRSFIMVCLLSLALLVDRRPFSLRGLALAAAMLMLISPEELPGPSFQMSFSAVLALICGYEALRPWLRRLRGASWPRRLGYNMLLLALSSVLAGSAAAPYGAYHFGKVQIYFVLANMVAVPLATLTVPAGLIGMLLMPLHLEALALVPMGWAAQGVIWIARATAALPEAAFRVPHIPAWGLCVFSIGLVWLGLWQTRWRLLGVALMVAGLASPLLDHPPDLLVSEDGRLIAVRAGQEAFLQQLPGGSRFVRDAWAQYWAVESFQSIPLDSGPEAPPLRASRRTRPPNGGPDLKNPSGNDAEAVKGSIAIFCGQGACLLRPYPDRPGAMLARGTPTVDFCTQISIVVSAEPARRRCPQPWPKLVDRFTVWRNGSAAIWLEPDGARVVTDRAERGFRPWVPPPPKPRKGPTPVLPPAMVDRMEQPPPPAGVPVEEGTNGE
jgi:competence protein ComEC